MVMNVYEDCPVFQNERYVLRLVEDGDIGDLLKVYSDVKAVPLFNGDNCNGDDFHYTTPERSGKTRIQTAGLSDLRLSIKKQTKL